MEEDILRLKIEKARDAFSQRYGKLPVSVDDLVKGGFMRGAPHDPYGGTFFIQNDGSISSTSGFAFATKKVK